MTPKVTAQEAFKFALSMVLFYALSLAMNWDMPDKGATVLVLISLGSTGASLNKAGMRILGTTVGLLVGFLIVGLFGQNAWFTYVFFAGYIMLIGYMMQVSRYSYTYFMAGILPLLIWATTYGTPDAATKGFHYASYRYLQTLSAVTLYTLVCTLFWNRTSGRQLAQLGNGFWSDLGRLFQCFRIELRQGEISDETADLRARVSGTLSQMLTTLDAAYADTFKVIEEKRAWESLRVQWRALLNAMELWDESVRDTRRLALTSLLPGLDTTLDTLGRRLEQIGSLWRLSESSGADSDLEKATRQPEALTLDIEPVMNNELSHADRAVLMNFIHQLQILDGVSREILRALRVVAGMDSLKGFAPDSTITDYYRPVLWDSQRLLKTISPVLCFTVAFLFWILCNPPGGPTIPTLAVSFGLSFLLTPMNPVMILIVLLLGLTLVAPIYMFVLPSLSTGPELLSLIIIYMFVFAYLGAKQPVLKLVPAMLFVNLTGISNTQHYSFMMLAGTALTLGLPFFVIALVDMFWTPSRPEQIVLHGLRRFFRGGARITSSFALNQPGDQRRAHRLRRGVFDSLMVPALSQLQLASKHLDYRRFEENDPEKVKRLLDGLQSLGLRFQALEIAHQRLLEHALERAEPLGALGAGLRQRLARVFERWSHGDYAGALEEERAALTRIGKDLEQHLDNRKNADASRTEQDEASQDLYALLGSVRGLVAAMARTQEILLTINWRRWAVTRF